MVATQPDGPGISPDLLDAHRLMLRIRLAEEAVLRMRLGGTIVGSVHLEIGQEAIATGVTGARRDAGDPVFATYRGHGWALACGVTIRELFAELAGRVGGPNDGRGGSAYFSAPSVGFMGENSIVGGGVPIAAGAALAARFDGSDRVAITVFGDGATNQGSVGETLNLAAAMALPLVFVCENNRYSELTRIADMVGNTDLAARAAAYGMPGVHVDGNDPLAVRAVAAEAIDRARSGGGPTFIEAHTQRLTGHYIGDAELYREPGELDAAREDEPLERIRRTLRGAGWTDEAIEDLEAPVRTDVEAAEREVAALPMVDTSGVREHLYG
jgi:TPP-dependent pyruvate/acetoin dehydrogenase alpha subunit